MVPRDHHENLYNQPPAVGHAPWDLTQSVAVAIRTAYLCDGTVDNDRLHKSDGKSRWAGADERAGYAVRLHRTCDVELVWPPADSRFRHEDPDQPGYSSPTECLSARLLLTSQSQESERTGTAVRYAPKSTQRRERSRLAHHPGQLIEGTVDIVEARVHREAKPAAPLWDQSQLVVG